MRFVTFQLMASVLFVALGLSSAAWAQTTEALSSYEQSLSIRRGIGDRCGEEESLNDIGGIYYSLGASQLSPTLGARGAATPAE